MVTYTLKNIDILENVQRKFTKRLPGMFNLTYHQRLVALNLESLELRRVRSDLILTYKIVFGLIGLNTDVFFSLNVSRNSMNLRGHDYQQLLTHSTSKKPIVRNMFAHRIVATWNCLPNDLVKFSSLKAFRCSLTNDVLVPFCNVYFR